MISVLDTGYGVQLPEALYNWFPYFNFDILDFGYPKACLGTMGSRLVASALWPFAAMVLVFVLSSTFVCHANPERDVSRGIHFVLGAFMVELLYVNANHVARTENAPNRPF